MAKRHLNPRAAAWPHFSTTLVASLLLLAGAAAPSPALADDPPAGEAPPASPPPSTDPPAAPPSAPPPAAPAPTTAAEPTVTIDDEQAELEREQRELEAAEEGPSQDEVVVESKAELEAKQATKEAEARSKGHAMQIGLRAGFGVPFLLGFRYSKSDPPCTADAAKAKSIFCNRLMSAVSEYELSFGLSDGFELTGMFRLGLSKDDVSGTLPIGFGAGFRSYTSPKSMFKFYLGVKGIVDVTSSDLPGWKSTDFGGRAEVGIQLDFLRFAGVWGHVAENVTVLRQFAFTTDFMAGVQLRFP